MQKYKLSVNSPNNVVNKTTQNVSVPMKWTRIGGTGPLDFLKSLSFEVKKPMI